MINITNLSKSYGKKVLFDELSLSINQGEKIGLIGPNGAGKTTLFSLVLGEIEPSAGNIHINKSIHIGYLPQEASFKSGVSVLSEVTEGDQTIMRLKKEKEALEASNKAGSKRYGEVLHDLEFLGYFDLEHKAKKILMGLGFKESDFNRLIKEMSGGWQMRALLAKLLTCHYDVLLLDEPTNYLDLAAAIWLKNYLINFKGTFIMISHDQDFLNEVTNYTFILEEGTIAKVKGNYEDYKRTREERSVFLLKQFKEQEKKRQQLKEFVSRFHAQPNKASQVRAKRRVLDKMERIIAPQDRRESIRSFRFPQGQRSGYRTVTLEKISKSYGDLTVYRDFDFEITKGEKGVLVGENGAGKSTLLKILGGIIDIDKGARSLGHNVDIGYFSQTRMDVLNPYNSVLEEACSAAGSRLSGENVRTLLGMFLFTGDDVDKKITVLSGGEKSRLILAKLLVNPPNFLLLDEPTTHLDTDAVDALIRALKEYEGTIVFISHDIHFVRSVANVVFEVKSGRVRKFPGDFDYYWQKGRKEDLGKEHKQKKPKARLSSHSKEERRRQKEPSSREKEKHNADLALRIRTLRKEKEKIELERNVKKRILSNRRGHHGQEVIGEYHSRLEKIEEKIANIDKEIKELKQLFI